MCADNPKPRLSDIHYGFAGMALDVAGCALFIASVFADSSGASSLAAALPGFIGLGAAFAVLCVGVLGVVADEQKRAAVLILIVSVVLLFLILRPELAH